MKNVYLRRYPSFATIKTLWHRIHDTPQSAKWSDALHLNIFDQPDNR